MEQQQFIAFLVSVLSGVVVALWLIYWVYRAKLLEREERRMMIERGMTPAAPVPVGWPGVRIREMELKAEERRLRIEKGLELSPDDAADTAASLLPKKVEATPERYLRRGLVALFIGLGMGIGYAILQINLDLATPETRNWLLGLSIVAPVVTLYGLAYVVFYRMAKDRLRETMTTAPDPDR